MGRWVVVVGTRIYGPFDDHLEAGVFASVLTAHVDPAVVAMLRNPVGELVGVVRSIEGERKGLF